VHAYLIHLSPMKGIRVDPAASARGVRDPLPAVYGRRLGVAGAMLVDCAFERHCTKAGAASAVVVNTVCRA
jgi:hypothetical protein